MPPGTRQGNRSGGQEVTPHESVTEAGGIAPFLAKYLTPIARVVPSHVKAEAFIALALAAVNRDPKLLRAAVINPQSLVFAMRMCAVLGHLPVKGMFALVPFNNSKALGGVEVVGIEEYRGVVERMYRAGGVVSVHSELVRERDEFELVRGHLPHHKFDGRIPAVERGRLDGVYAWAVLHTGNLSQVVWLNRAEVKKHRDASRSGDAFWGPWTDDPNDEAPWAGDMWTKTGLHVLERWVPTSAEYRWTLAESTAAAVSPGSGFGADIERQPVRPPGGDDVADTDPNIVDAVIVPDGPAQPDPGGREAWPDTAKPGSGAPDG